MRQKKQSKNYSAPALEKGLDILELLSNFQEGLTQAEIANKLNKSVNEIYRMLSTLRHREYITFDEETDVYNLSYKILNMTAKFEPFKTLGLEVMGWGHFWMVLLIKDTLSRLLHCFGYCFHFN